MEAADTHLMFAFFGLLLAREEGTFIPSWFWSAFAFCNALLATVRYALEWLA